ncbi:SUKH-3 domain-containing protein, partial [Streptomyces sp. NPDC057927]
MHPDRSSSPKLSAPLEQGGPPSRFPVPVDAALRSAGWQPGRWDIKQAEYWADALRSHESSAGHRHAVFPAAVEAWAEFGGLH